MNKLKYLVIQIDTAAPSRRDGRGVLTPVNADGYYLHREDADATAKEMAEKFPHLKTHVVEVLK